MRMTLQQSNEDDTAAAALVMQAKDVLSNFYSENNLVGLVQTGATMDPGAAGDAPPPPPPTWEAPYGGKTEQSTGIIAILGMVAEDVAKDLALAKAAEEKAQ